MTVSARERYSGREYCKRCRRPHPVKLHRLVAHGRTLERVCGDCLKELQLGAPLRREEARR